MAAVATNLDARVVDFLDDKLQTLGDVDSLDALLANIHRQQGLLQQQLDDAQHHLSAAKQAARDHPASLQSRVASFGAEQADIHRRLLALTASETSDEAVPRFEAVLDSLQRLDVATAYLELLQQVHVLSEETQSQLRSSNNDAALEPYRQLRSLHTQLHRLQEDAEGAAPQLLHHVYQITQALRSRIFDAFAEPLERVLKKMKWPSPSATVPSTLAAEWETAITRLLHLQMPELEGMPYAAEARDKPTLPDVLLPFQVLVRPLEMRFRYHFEGDKPTNRMDRPEYFLAHITSLLDDYSGFVADFVQPVLLRHFRGTHLALNPVYIDATSAFITSLLPMLRTKIGSLLPAVAGQPQLLSHLMHEVMAFDTTMREDWGYDGGQGLEGWKGLAWDLLVQGDWFGRWLQVEKDFALARYQSIVDAPDFGHLDYESVDPKATKPTKGAIRVLDLLETVTDLYRSLTSCSQKLQFLIGIQIEIFDKLKERLEDNLAAYLTMTTSFSRAVGGVTKEEQDKLLGVEGLERLCRTYGSADYLERAMRDWSDDVFFLDLFEELNDRAHRAKTIGTMSMANVAERTSSAVGSDGETGALFDETAASYSGLRERSEAIIIDTLNSNVRMALRAYRHINPWTTLASTSAMPSATQPPTAELDPLLAHLKSTLGFLSRALAPAPLRRITRAVLATISDTLWNNVLTRHRFSTSGAAQLQADLAAICRVVHGAAGPGVAEAGLRKCIEGAHLVGLPVKGSKSEATPRAPGTSAEEREADWDAWEGEAENEVEQDEEAAGGNDRDLGLWEVERRLFADNQSARDVLEELGLELLSEAEARTVLGKRVELAG